MVTVRYTLRKPDGYRQAHSSRHPRSQRQKGHHTETERLITIIRSTSMHRTTLPGARDGEIFDGTSLNGLETVEGEKMSTWQAN